MNQVLAQFQSLLQSLAKFSDIPGTYQNLFITTTSPEFKAEFDCSLTKNDCSKCL